VPVLFYSDGVPFQPANKRKIIRWIGNVLAGEKKKTGHLCYIFVSDERIRELNRQYLQHDYFTDIITFDNSKKDIVAGEMYIGIDVVRSNATIYGTSFNNELLRVMVHGVLHLCGYNDKTDDEQALMRTRENKYIDLFDGVAG
jgi:rRNA maturation RNase YbeY